MKMVRMLIQLPEPLKHKLDTLREQGYTAAGYIRHVLEKELAHVGPGPKKPRQK